MLSEARDIWEEAPPDLDALLAKAGSDDSFERWASAFELGELADDRAVGALRELSNDDDEHVREAASIALGKLATGDSAARKSARIAVEEVQGARTVTRRRLRSHLDAPSFTPWKIKPLPAPDKGNAWVLEASLMDIILTEGPIPGSRLMRLYAQGCRMNGASGPSASRLHTAIRSLIRKGKVARSDNYGSDIPERWLLHERGAPGIVVRQRGCRELRDLATEEVRAALEASLGPSARRRIERDLAFEQILSFYGAQSELDTVGKLLAAEWADLLS